MAFSKNIFPVSKWVIRETHVCPYDFEYSEGEGNWFNAYAVEIGESFNIITTIEGTKVNKIPIIRWMTEKKLNYIKRLDGDIIGL